MISKKSFSKKVYVYPISLKKSNLNNPYLSDFIINLESEGYIIINKNEQGNPLFPLLKYLNKSNVFIFHWLENIPSHKSGFLQYCFAIFSLEILSLLNKKIVFFLHNKRPHSTKSKFQNFQSISILLTLKKKATHIITHSQEGLALLNEYMQKSKYIIHPTKNKLVENIIPDYKYDLLIWGAISKYKGVYEFLEYHKNNSEINKLKVKIIGNCSDEKLLIKIKSIISSNVQFENRPISFKELEILRSNVRFILIPYKSETVLSSSVLMDSLSYGYSVIGPDYAAFRDLKMEKRINVLTYANFSEISQLIKIQKNEFNYNDFLEEHNWSNFTKKFIKTIS